PQCAADDAGGRLRAPALAGDELRLAVRAFVSGGFLSQTFPREYFGCSIICPAPRGAGMISRRPESSADANDPRVALFRDPRGLLAHGNARMPSATMVVHEPSASAPAGATASARLRLERM